MNIAYLFLLIILRHLPLIAQFNDSTNHYINYSGSGTWNKADEGRYLILNNLLKFSIRRKSLVLNSSNSWLFGRQQEKLSNNDFSASLDFDLYKTWEEFNYWGLATFDKSF